MGLKLAIQQMPRQKLLAISFTIVAFIASAIILTIVHLNNIAYDTKTYADIPEYSRLKLPDESKKLLQAQIRNLLRNNFEISDTTKVTVDIREDTLIEKDKYYSFIVDVDAYEQTFAVTVDKTLKDKKVSSDGILIKCVKPELRKYPNAKCYAMYNSTDSIDLYFPYRETIAEDVQVNAFAREKLNHKEYVEVNVNSCGDKTLLDKGVESVKEHLKSYYVDIDKVEFYTRDLCEGGL